MTGFFDHIKRRMSDDTALFRTHRSESQDTARAVGSLVDHAGTLYVVTRWVELPKVPLSRGGSVGEWQVFGRVATPEEIDALIGEAAEQLLVAGDSPGPTARASDGHPPGEIPSGGDR